MTTDELLLAERKLKQAQDTVYQVNKALLDHYFPLLQDRLKVKDFSGAMTLLERVPQGPTHYKLWALIQKAK